MSFRCLIFKMTFPFKNPYLWAFLHLSLLEGRIGLLCTHWMACVYRYSSNWIIWPFWGTWCSKWFMASHSYFMLDPLVGLLERLWINWFSSSCRQVALWCSSTAGGISGCGALIYILASLGERFGTRLADEWVLNSPFPAGRLKGCRKERMPRIQSRLCRFAIVASLHGK